MNAREVCRCAAKLGLCVRNARQAARDAWQHAENKRQAREFRSMARESIHDARYWRAELRKAWEATCTA